jgi:hypothetical protein
LTAIPDTLQCTCARVRLRIAGAPAARAHCHCNACRDFYGTPVLSATAWDPANVTIEHGADSLAAFQHPTRQLKRHFCRHCGETLFGNNRLGMVVIPNSLFARAAGNALPAALQPTLHLFYRHRVVDVVDTLPKYLDGWDGLLHEPEPV